MKVTLIDNKYLPLARRNFKKDGYCSLTVRYGEIYTIHMVHTKQHDVMAKASRLMSRDWKKDGVKEYWQTVARERGYKTACGAAMAFYIAKVREEMGLTVKGGDVKTVSENSFRKLAYWKRLHEIVANRSRRNVNVESAPESGKGVSRFCRSESGLMKFRRRRGEMWLRHVYGKGGKLDGVWPTLKAIFEKGFCEC